MLHCAIRNMSTEGQPTVPPTTPQDAPRAVRRLLESYDPAALQWDVSDDRYAIVVAILTRGDPVAERTRRRAAVLSRRWRRHWLASWASHIARPRLVHSELLRRERDFLKRGLDVLGGARKSNDLSASRWH